MDIGFLFGWAKENGIDLPTKSDGSINIPAAFALCQTGIIRTRFSAADFRLNRVIRLANTEKY